MSLSDCEREVLLKKVHKFIFNSIVFRINHLKYVSTFFFSLPPANKVAGRLCFYSCLWFCSRGGGRGVVSQHALQQVSRGRWHPRVPCRFPGPHPVGKLRGIWPGGLQAHNQGGSWRESGWGVSRPTTKGEVEGDLAGGGGLQAQTQGVCSWGLSAPGGGSTLGGVETPPWRLLLRTVRILLECILVSFVIFTSLI